MKVIVNNNQLKFAEKFYRCAIGKSGFSSHKKEGDGCTPLGVFPLRECWYRADRLPLPDTVLPLKIIRADDGWCDDPKSPDYNRHIIISSSADKYSFEHLWRDDGRYDLIVPLGYNDGPVVPGQGSAIFLHVAAEGYAPTEGCVAMEKKELLFLLAHVEPDTVIEIGNK